MHRTGTRFVPFSQHGRRGGASRHALLLCPLLLIGAVPVGTATAAAAAPPSTLYSVQAALVEPPTTTSAGRWHVERGDSLWSISTEALTTVGEPAAPPEVGTYWRAVVAANPQYANPDLIRPGDTVHLPAIGSRPASVEVYFLSGDRLEAVERTVAAPAVGAGALRALLAGPRVAGLGSEVPDETDLLGVSVTDGVATVDLSQDFESGGGSLSVRARVAQIVFTLTQFDTVDAVAFQIEGEPVTALSGEGLVLDEPVGRDRFADLAPRTTS